MTGRRHKADWLLRWGGMAAVTLSLGIVAVLIGAIAWQGMGALDWPFLTGADSVDASRVGIGAALRGTLLTLTVTLAVSLPLGIAVALYLEEFAPRHRALVALEAMIANLAAVPPIIYGLLGLAVFINAAGLPRSAPLVAGLTLALMTMPVVTLAGRAALRAVPGDIRDAARGIGASPVQVAFHHVLPAAGPGIATGALLGTARALGEVAPLLLIGMRAFIAAPPHDPGSPATVLPMQIFLWSDRIGHGFLARTSAACLVLLVLLLLLNGAAAWARHRWEQAR